MKSLKSLFSINMIVLSLVILASCSKSNDPAPAAQKTQTELNLEKVTASLAGAWTFKTVAVTQVASGKNGTTGTCARTELTAANFGNTQWQNIAGIVNIIYSGTNTVTLAYPCIASNPRDVQVWKVTQTSETTFTVALGDILIFNVNSADISATEIKGTLVSNGSFVSSTLGYNVVYTFTKS